jgi:predicted alpha/beta hydrolase
MDNTLPRPTSEWQHSNGVLYVVLCIANEFTEQPDRYPQTVVYMGLNGRVWSRPATDWHRSMTLVRDAADAPAEQAQDSQYDPSRPVSASNLPDSMRITPDAAKTFLSRWRAVIQELPVSRIARARGLPGTIVGEPDGESE